MMPTYQKSWKLEFGQISCQKMGAFILVNRQNEMNLLFWPFFFLRAKCDWDLDSSFYSNLPCRLWNMLYYLIIKTDDQPYGEGGGNQEAKVYSSSRCVNESKVPKTVSPTRNANDFLFLVKKIFFFWMIFLVIWEYVLKLIFIYKIFILK